MANSFSSRKDENSFSSLREAAALRAAALREEARKEAAPPPLLSATSRADPEPPRPTPLKNEGRGSSRVAWADTGQNDARVAAAQVGSPSSSDARHALLSRCILQLGQIADDMHKPAAGGVTWVDGEQSAATRLAEQVSTLKTLHRTA